MVDEKTESSGPGEGAAEDPFAMVNAIAEAFGKDGKQEYMTDENAFEFSLPDALSLLPSRYIKESDIEDSAGETLVLTLDDLFERLAQGKVELPVSGLAYFIPLHLVYQAALSDDTMVELPLQSVVKWVGINEFAYRCPPPRTYVNLTSMRKVFFKA